MNVNYPKNISINLSKFVLPLFVVLCFQLVANAQTIQLSGNWIMYNDKSVKFDKPATITQNGANLSINNGYGSNSTAVLSGNTLKTSDGLTGTVSADGARINWNIGYVWVKQGANNQPNKIEGETTYEPIPLTDASSTSNKVVRNTNSSTPQTINYTQTEQNCFDMVKDKVAYDQLGTKAWNEVNIRKLCKGTTDPAATISCFKNIISSFNDWNRGITECAGTQKTADSGMITRTITVKNNSGMILYSYLIDLANYENPKNKDDIKTSRRSLENLNLGNTGVFGGDLSSPINEIVELWIIATADHKPIFKATLPKNKDLTNFCYEVTGTTYIPVVKTCDGTPTYEAKYIAFKNESAFAADMRLTYYPLASSTTKTASTEPTLLGYSRKLYLPMDADTNRKMTFSVNIVAGSLANSLISKDVSLNDFDTVGSSCYKTWGSGLGSKASPCSLNPNARTIKLWNNAGYPASLLITYYDKDNTGKDVARTVNTNDIELTQTDTIEVPNGTSLTPVKIEFRNKWNGNKIFSTMNASANFTGELCYKVEGTTFAPTAATCDDTVGDTSGNTRQIRFQNDAGYDAQMTVTYFVDEVISGNKIPMLKTLTTGMINGLGGKFRLVTIPKNTSKGMPITISLQGSATVKNDMFSTTLPADFAASPQPCFKVWGTALNPDGGKCNQ